MPIRPSEKARYPKDWKAISLRIRARSGGRCECLGECGIDHREVGETLYRCFERDRTKARTFRGQVIFTVMHLNHTPEDCRDENLKAACQRCHLRYDRDHHRQTMQATREANNMTPRML